MNKRLFSQIKNLRGYIILFCFLLVQQYVIAQINKKGYQDSMFNKYASTSIHEFTGAKPYYIIAWEKSVPQNIKIIRQLAERTAIVELKSQQAFDLLKQQVKIA